MQAYAEGYELLARSGLGIDVEGALDAWRHGSVVRSWLLDLLVRALQQTPDLEGIAGVAQDSGEGRWTVQEAIERGVATPVISAALFARFVSQARRVRGHEGGRRAAQPVRRPRHRERAGRASPPADARHRGGPGSERAPQQRRPGAVRRHRRPGPQEDLPRGLRDGAGRPCAACRSSAWRRRSGTTRRCASGRHEPIAERIDGDVDEAAWKALADKLSYVSGDYRERVHVRDPGGQAGRASSGRCSTWPSRRRCSTTWCRAWPRVGLTGERLPGGGREAVRPRPGLGRRAQRGAPPGVPRGGDLPHRPLPGQGVGRGPAGLPVRQLDARTAVEPQLRLQRADHDGRVRSASRAGAGSTSRWARCGTCSRTTCCRWWPCWPWSRRSRPTRTRSATRRCGCGARSAPLDPDQVVRGQYRGYTGRDRASTPAATSRPSSPCSSRSSRGAGRGCRGWCARASACR